MGSVKKEEKYMQGDTKKEKIFDLMTFSLISTTSFRCFLFVCANLLLIKKSRIILFLYK